MKNSFGVNVVFTVFGESHGPAVGCVIDGLKPGIKVDYELISHYLDLRRPYGSISTARREKDEFSVISGVYNGRTTGTPVCIVIPNSDTDSSSYEKNYGLARPSHADYTGYVKYNGFNDPRGGGHFSGRITAAIVAAGAFVMPFLNDQGIFVGTHIAQIGGVFDRPFDNIDDDINDLKEKSFAVLDEEKADEMKSLILAAKDKSDSVGGVLETAVTGLKAGIGDPFFDSLESILSHAIFSIPGVKGIEFGAGFKFGSMYGSAANDPFALENGRVVTVKNNSGGINGGISNGMPIVFRCAVRPTPTVSIPQRTVDFINVREAVIEAGGRHDPCIVHRVRAVVECVTAVTLCDLLSGE